MPRNGLGPVATLALGLLLLPACTAGRAGVAAGGDPAGYDGEWLSLFNGRDLAGWNNPFEWGEAWVENGEIHLRADRKFFLMTDAEFDDFVFEGEILLPDRESNSGFMFRANVEKNRVFGYQAEVDPSDRKWSGGFYDEGRRAWLQPVRGDSASVAAFRAVAGDAFDPEGWNRYRIAARGDSIRIWVNGRLTAAARDSVDRAGPIGLQHHGEKGKIYRFRNLRLMKLSGVPDRG